MSNFRVKGLTGVDWLPAELEDVGIYKHLADTQGKTLSMWLEEKRAEKTGETTYYGMTKAEVLRKKDELRKAGKDVPLTAFESLLEKAQIKVVGPYTDPIAKFYSYSDVLTLFPEYIADRVYAGLLKTSLVSQFSMGETVIDGITFEKLYLEDTQDDRDLYQIGKYEDLPETRIKVGEKSIHLGMYGRRIVMSQFDKNATRANVFGRFMERIGQQLGVRHTDMMFYRLINGDGNSGTTPGTTVTANASGAGELSLEDAISWSVGLPTPYKMDKFVMRKANLVKWYNRLYDATTTSVAGSERLVIFPDVIEWDRSVITANYAWGVDSRYAVEYISSGGVQTQAENIVRNLTNETAVYHLYEFAIADQYAVALWNLSS
jgi:hypothetical protein